MSATEDHRDVSSVEAGLDLCDVAMSDVLDRFRSARPGRISQLEWLELRASVGMLLHEMFRAMGEVDRGLGVSDVHDRLRQYLESRPGVTVENYELMGVAGSLEWARRLRELANEGGLPLERGPEAGLRSGQYRYVPAD